MNAHNGDSRDAVTPELLAAYVDGELTPAETRRVEAWLAEHPEARDDVAAQRHLARLFEDAAPPPPPERQWAEALARVERSLAVPRPAARRRAALAVAALIAVAALVLLALALKGPPPQHAAPDDEGEWAVVSADDIDIISMDDRDRGALVVGEPPLNEPMELLTEDEVKVQKLPEVSGRVGRVRVMHDSGARLVLVTLGADSEDDDDP
jgi:hypothetical protein